MSCFVSLSFAAIAPAVAEFDWVTSPFEPGLSTRIEVASFFGAICAAVASASASCVFVASCPATWVWSEPEPPPVWDWSTLCFVSLSFAAMPTPVVEFDCVTSPLEPGLSTRMSNVRFVAPPW